MTPEVRNGIKNLLGGHEPDEATVAWLKLQLEHNDWDNSLERMGGGSKARDAYMNPVFDAQCSVTAFDMHAQLTDDGRERGLWIWLLDESKARAATYDKWAEGALEEFSQLIGVDEKAMEKFRLSMSMDTFKNIANSKVHEAALLEWPTVKKLHAVIGAAIKKHEAKEKKERAQEEAQERRPRSSASRRGSKARQRRKGRTRRSA